MKDMTLNRDQSGLTRRQTGGFGDSHHRWTGASVSVPEAKAVPKPGEEHAANSASFIADNFGISKELADRVAGKRGINEKDPVLHFERVRYADDRPLVLEKSWISVAQCPDLKREDIKGSLY